MVNLINCGRNEFIRRIQAKKLYCFGAGKYLQHFVESNYGTPIEAVIDNYRYIEEAPLYIGESVVPVISADEFEAIVDENSTVIITCLAVEEVLAQLDSIEKFNGLECYAEILIDEVTESTELPEVEMPKKSIIPTKIHYCWFGGKPLPKEAEKCIESWKRYCPDYEIIRWDESNYDINKNDYIRQAYEQKKWAFVADYARVDILYHEGGLYFDTDVEVMASFDEFLVWDLFCGFEPKRLINWGLGYGAVKGHRILKSVMEVYENMPFVFENGTLNLKTCPVIQSEVLKQYGFKMDGEFQVRDNVALYPQDFFSPFGQYKFLGKITKNTHSIHHYAASWFDSKQQNAKAEYEKKMIRIAEHNNICLKEPDYSEQNNNAAIKKYQIWECLSEAGTAGSKAPTDIKTIAGRQGYQVINIRRYKGQEGDAAWRWSHRRLEEEWNNCYKMIPDNSILLLQHPFWQEQQERNDTLLKLKKEKHVKIISLIHDVESLRGTFLTEYMQAEFAFMLEIADVLIVHNNRMREYFLSLGVEPERLVSLNIFDYLISDFKEKSCEQKEFERCIRIAGNLDIQKSPYIKKMTELEGVNIHLYGPNYVQEPKEKCAANIMYHGAFPAEEIPKLLHDGFGLVWDGESLETCLGNIGEYLKYNNPHKLSLYLAAGLPVFIWKEAATAEYVVKNGLGIAVNSLHEIKELLDNMSGADYQQYMKNVKTASEKIRSGAHAMTAIGEAERLVEE